MLQLVSSAGSGLDCLKCGLDYLKCGFDCLKYGPDCLKCSQDLALTVLHVLYSLIRGTVGDEHVAGGVVVLAPVLEGGARKPHLFGVLVLGFGFWFRVLARGLGFGILS